MAGNVNSLEEENWGRKPQFLFALQDLPELIQKRFLAKGIELEEHSLTAARGDGRNINGVTVAEQRHAQAYTVVAHEAESFKYPYTAADIAHTKITAFFQVGRNTAAYNAVLNSMQDLTEIPCHFFL